MRYMEWIYFSKHFWNVSSTTHFTTKTRRRHNAIWMTSQTCFEAGSRFASFLIARNNDTGTNSLWLSTIYGSSSKLILITLAIKVMNSLHRMSLKLGLHDRNALFNFQNLKTFPMIIPNEGCYLPRAWPWVTKTWSNKRPEFSKYQKLRNKQLTYCKDFSMKETIKNI